MQDSFKTGFIQNDYRYAVKQLDFIELKRVPYKSVTYRKLIKFNNKRAMTWAQMSQGFIWGGFSGAALGVVFGIVPAIRYKSPATLVISMLMSGGMFACIGGFGSLVHSR